MKAATLVEMKICFDLLRQAEKNQEPLSGHDYVRCLRAQFNFDYELEEILAVEVTA